MAGTENPLTVTAASNTKSPTSLRIRPATTVDAQAISHIGRTVTTNSFGYSMLKQYLDQYLIDNYSPPNITKDIGRKDTDIIVAVTVDSHGQDEIVGFAQLTRGTTEPCLACRGSYCQLQRLYVAEDWHGKGIGGALMKSIEKMAREKQFRGMYVSVLEENVGAQRLYARAGFVQIGTKNFDMGEGMSQTDLIMWRDL